MTKARTLKLQGTHFDGKEPVGRPATLEVGRSEAVLKAVGLARTYASVRLRVSPRIGRTDRFIALPDGGQFQCRDIRLLNWLPQEISSEGPVSWLEGNYPVALASVAVIVVLLLASYLYGLPYVAERVAARIPIETEQILGDEILQWLDESNLLTPAHVDMQKQQALRLRFAEMNKGLADEIHYKLEFRCGKAVGPNAFALPGGTIIITDQMVAAAESEEEILAVLAHEIGHIERDHIMRKILQGSVVAVVITAITADATSIGTAVAGAPAVLLNAKFSRELESEADEFGFDLLEKHGISPEAFASLMERLDKSKMPFGMGYMSSHPLTSERVARARERAGAFKNAAGGFGNATGAGDNAAGAPKKSDWVFEDPTDAPKGSNEAPKNDACKQ